jgi:hypothetical protein
VINLATILVCIPKAPDSNFVPPINYPEIFLVFLNPTGKFPEDCFKLLHEQHLPNPLQFINRKSSYLLKLYVSATESIIEGEK